jgi:pyroglutamyl-peptidase
MLLLTSFTTWETTQRTNASDTLVARIEAKRVADVQTLRNLPVNTEEAFELVKDKILEERPHTVILCGMTEKRSGALFLEKRARKGDDELRSSTFIDALATAISPTAVSYDAGQFVCEGLYYETLRFCQNEFAGTIAVLFVHVPRFTRAQAQIYENAMSELIAHLQAQQP